MEPWRTLEIQTAGEEAFRPKNRSPNITKHFVRRYFGCQESRAPKSLTRKIRAHLPTKSGNYRGYTWNCLATGVSWAYRLTLKSCVFFAIEHRVGGIFKRLTPLRLLACRPSFMTSQALRVVTEVGENTQKPTATYEWQNSPFPQNRPPKKQEQTPTSFCEYNFRSICFETKSIKCSQFRAEWYPTRWGYLQIPPNPRKCLRDGEPLKAQQWFVTQPSS